MRTLPRLSHKDYVFIAETIANLDGETTTNAGTFSVPTRVVVAEAFADALRGTNPAYSRDRFLSAATGKPTTRRDVSR